MKQIAALLAGIVVLGGCGDDPVGATDPVVVPSLDVSTNPGASGLDAQSLKDLAALRRVTARFHSFEAANDAGWNAQITGCMSDPSAGGMGFHYGNPRLIDGAVNAEEPELLLYEPEPNGQMRLVAVEYIVPLTAWSAPNPPRLFGQDFKVNSAFGIWALHAWVWDANPSGLFADWNPRVECPSASASVMSHD